MHLKYLRKYLKHTILNLIKIYEINNIFYDFLIIHKIDILNNKCVKNEVKMDLFDRSLKNKRIKKSWARGIRTPDLRHEETKSACEATRANDEFVYKTHTILPRA